MPYWKRHDDCAIVCLHREWPTFSLLTLVLTSVIWGFLKFAARRSKLSWSRKGPKIVGVLQLCYLRLKAPQGAVSRLFTCDSWLNFVHWSLPKKRIPQTVAPSSPIPCLFNSAVLPQKFLWQMYDGSVFVESCQKDSAQNFSQLWVGGPKTLSCAAVSCSRLRACCDQDPPRRSTTKKSRRSPPGAGIV